MKLTKLAVDKIKAPVDRIQVFYRDDVLKGFALRVTSNGVKSFYSVCVNGNWRVIFKFEEEQAELVDYLDYR